MGLYYRQHSRQILLLLIAILWLVAFPQWRDETNRNPLDAIISISPQGTVEQDIRVPIPENYFLDLWFERDGVGFEQLNVSLGGCISVQQCFKGVPLSIRWSLKSIQTGVVVASGERDTIGSQGWSGAHVYRYVDRVKVQPGTYAFKAEVLRPVPELAYLRTHIVLHADLKWASTWQITAGFLGSIVELYIALPIVVYQAAILLWHAGLTLRSKGRSA